MAKDLKAVTQEKISGYKRLLNSPSKATSDLFWDVVVLTARDDEQRTIFELQIDEKKSRNELPVFVRYYVFADPPGAKIGSGGATMHALEQLELSLGAEEMIKSRVMLLHAGGYSQRLASLSVVGKAFMALPFGEPMFQVLDALLALHFDLPARMDPGVYLCASDILFLYNGTGDWDLRGPGVTAIAHPGSLELARNHGVFILEEGSLDKQQQQHGSAQPAEMARVKKFVHKQNAASLRDAGAVIPGTEQVYVDLAYYMDHSTARKLIKFYGDHKPLQCELEAYGDFLQALGPGSTREYFNDHSNVTHSSEDLVATRGEIWKLLRGTEFKAVVFHQAQFNHVGTTREYLHHFCYNETLREACQFGVETAVAENGTGTREKSLEEPKPKKAKTDVKFQECTLIHTVFADRTRLSVGRGSVLEYCTVEGAASIGKNCIVSNLTIPDGCKIPDNSFLHTIPVRDGKECAYATFAFDIGDSMKTSRESAECMELPYCELTIGEAMTRLGRSSGMQDLWPLSPPSYSLWNARLFPVLLSRSASAASAVDSLRTLKGLQDKPPILEGSPKWLSVCEMLAAKSVASLQQYHKELREVIVSSS